MFAKRASRANLPSPTKRPLDHHHVWLYSDVRVSDLTRHRWDADAFASTKYVVIRVSHETAKP